MLRYSVGALLRRVSHDKNLKIVVRYQVEVGAVTLLSRDHLTTISFIIIPDIILAIRLNVENSVFGELKESILRW